MEIQCPKCETIYEVEEKQLRGGASTLKCSQCQYLFRVQSEATLSRETQQRWMLEESSSGDVRYFTRFTQLRDWILEGRVSRADAISRTGKKWKKLGEIGEFEPLFEREASSQSKSSERSPEGAGSSAAQPRAKKRTKLMVGDQSSEPSSAPSPSPEPNRGEAEPNTGSEQNWELGDRFGDSDSSDPDSSEEPGDMAELALENESSSSSWGLVATILVVFLFTGGGYAYYKGLIPDYEKILGTGPPTQKIRNATEASSQNVIRAVGTAEESSASLVDRLYAEATDAIREAVGTAEKKAKTRAEKLEEADKEDESSGRLSVGALVGKGKDALENGRTNDAKRLFGRALERDPENAEAMTGMGWVHLAEGQPGEASEEFDDAIQIDPDYGDAYIGMGKARRKMGQSDKAIEAYQNYIDKHPDGPQASIAEYQLQQLKD